MNDDTVLERRDASDLETNDEVEQTVDEMLDTDDLETGKSGDEGAAEASTGGNESSAADPENFDFENQEWTLGCKREPEVHEIQGMKFLFEEPENDDTVLNELDQVGDDDRSAQMKALVQLVVAKPEVTDDRWEQMSFAAKLGLAGQAAEFLGLGEGFLNE